MATTAQPPGVTHAADVVHQVGVAIGNIVQEAQLPVNPDYMNGYNASQIGGSGNAIWSAGEVISRLDSLFLGLHADLSIYPRAFDNFATNLAALAQIHGPALTRLTRELEDAARPNR